MLSVMSVLDNTLRIGHFPSQPLHLTVSSGLIGISGSEFAGKQS